MPVHLTALLLFDYVSEGGAVVRAGVSGTVQAVVGDHEAYVVQFPTLPGPVTVASQQVSLSATGHPRRSLRSACGDARDHANTNCAPDQGDCPALVDENNKG